MEQTKHKQIRIGTELYFCGDGDEPLSSKMT